MLESSECSAWVSALEAFYKDESPILFIILGKNSLKKIFTRETWRS